MLFQEYQAAENFLESLGNMSSVNFFNGTSNPSHHFARAKHLLKLAGHPDRGLKIIHVAGTSGKGSTANYIYNILQRTGFKVGAHFSPFVSVATEKIQINGRFISAREFVDLIEEIKPIIQKCHDSFGTPSYFEAWVLLALLYFRQHQCDYVVLEVGCGGRFDATNAVEKTLASVITNIGFDHMHILGNTIPKIAFEKAGIIRKGGTVFTAPLRPAAMRIIQQVAAARRAICHVCPIRPIRPLCPSPNAALAAAVCRHLGIAARAIETGVAKAAPLPARFEIVQRKPIVILDGAHNPDKLAFLSQMVETQNFASLHRPKRRHLHLVCALTDHKNIHDCYKKIARLADFVYATRPLNAFRKFADPTALAREIRKIKRVPIQTFLDPNAALNAALKRAKPNDIILITGSFFLCSDLRKRWVSEEDQLSQRTNFPKK